MGLPLVYNKKHKPSIMKKLSLIFAVVILFAASACTSYTCPTYSNIDTPQEVPAELDQNNL